MPCVPFGKQIYIYIFLITYDEICTSRLNNIYVLIFYFQIIMFNILQEKPVFLLINKYYAHLLLYLSKRVFSLPYGS